MTYKEIVDKIRPEFDKALAFFEKEVSQFRTGRASPSLVENVIVECFGQTFPLKQLASISISEARQILLQPWDKSYVEGIISALQKTGIGANPVADKESIRINLPPLTEDYRKDLLRLISEKQEDTRKVIRKWREQAWSEAQAEARAGKLREDDKFKTKDELQKLIDEYNEKIDQIGERKKKEISE